MKSRGAILLALFAAAPLLRGGAALSEEYAFRDGRMTLGVVTRKLSSTGEDGSVVIGGSRFSRPLGSRWPVPTVLTSEGFRFDDVIARVLRTGSRETWMVEYTYECSRSPRCHQREEVSHALWRQLRVGQMMNVRVGPSGLSGRIAGNEQWSIGVAKLAIGSALAIPAALLAGFFSARRRKWLTVPAVVTSVEPSAGGWRVRFAYFTPDGTAHESADEVYVDSVRSGDACIAVYPPERPQLGTLRLVTGQASSSVSP